MFNYTKGSNCQTASINLQGNSVGIALYPRQYPASEVNRVNALVNTVYTERINSDGWLARDAQGRPKFVDYIPWADAKIPLWGFAVHTGKLQSKKRGQSNCDPYKSRGGRSLEVNRFICTKDFGKSYSECIFDLKGSILQEYAFNEDNRRRNLKPGEVYVPTYGDEIELGDKVIDDIVMQSLIDAGEDIDIAIAEGDVASEREGYDIFDGLFKQAYYALQNGETKHKIGFKVVGMAAGMSIYYETAGKTQEVKFNTDIATTVEDLVAKLNDWAYSAGNNPVLAGIDTDADGVNVPETFWVEATSVNTEIPIKDWRIGYSQDDSGYDCPVEGCSAYLASKTYVEYRKSGDSPICLDYAAELTGASARKYFRDQVIKKIELDPFISKVKRQLQLHVSPELAQALKYGSGEVIQGGIQVEDFRTLEDIAASWGIEGIYEKPSMYGMGNMFLLTPKGNIAVGINNSEDGAVNHLRVSIGGKGATTTCGKSLEDHVIIDHKMSMGVSFKEYKYVVVPMGGCYVANFGEPDPDCAGGPVVDNCTSSSAPSATC